GYNGVCVCGAAGGGRGQPARMAAPMREGAPAGGARPAPHAHPANFEYDDNEWDIGIGDLIIDLDADIEKTDEAGGMAARAEPDAQRTALKMKIKRTKPGTKSSEAKHEIVKSNEMNGEPKASVPAQAAPPAAAKRGSGGHRRDKARDKHHHPHPPHDVNGVHRVANSHPNAPGPPAPAPAHPAALPAPAQHAPHAPHAPHAAPAAKPEPRPAPAPRLENKPPAPAPPAPTAPTPAPAPAPAPAQLPAHTHHTSHAPHAPSTPSKPEPDDSRQETHSSQPPTKKQKTEPKCKRSWGVIRACRLPHRFIKSPRASRPRPAPRRRHNTRCTPQINAIVGSVANKAVYLRCRIAEAKLYSTTVPVYRHLNLEMYIV
ncbi:hypothetical protein SFRURICE_013062, partial [Spodoptera frugiperda]